jgi:very-short-patch-repair endonuclease
LGLKFNHVPEGVFDSGGSGTNRVEAKAVCRAIFEHARRQPQLSLGVAAFSVRQQQAILDELELLRRENPETEPFFNDHATEPFFVKNLENVQGDERDVIFISVGYGRDAHGFLAMRFGPLSNEGGERRLNVLISRAKQRCEVFSSITADEIDLERTSGRGVQALKTFLGFAQTGRLDVSKVSSREEQSPFEESVRRAVESLGYEVHAQVGLAGFFIDLAVVDRERGGRYLLGIECDGASYHAARSARDRDRLRQSVLEDHGWIIHRIWSTDWFQRPAEQLRRVADAIERAKTVLDEKARHDETPPVSTSADVSIERETVLSLDAGGLNALAVPYKMACITVPRQSDPCELPTRVMADVLFRVVEQESPIHEDELLVRVRDLWNLQRAGSRVQDAVARGVRALLVTQRCLRDNAFLSLPDGGVTVRNREGVDSATLRKPDMLPPAEIRAAVLALIDAHHGATVAETPVAVARVLGFRTTSGALRTVIQEQVGWLVEHALIQQTEDMLRRSVKA